MSEILAVIAVFYTELMLVDTGSFSPSAFKPRHVLTAWQQAQLPLAVRAVEPVSEIDLCLAHDPAFVRGILAGALPKWIWHDGIERGTIAALYDGRDARGREGGA